MPTAQAHGLLALARQVATEPMFAMLIAAAAIYLVLGDVREALVLAASVLVILAITVVQERRTERALEALRDLSSPRALVVRGGEPLRIAGTEVVRGDLLVLGEGDRVAADARLAEAHDLRVDESLLTGESVPVDKHAGDAVLSGTLVVRGGGNAEVTATGPRSELGRIGASLAQVDSGKTSLERETARIVRVIAVFALSLCVIVAILYIALRGEPLAGILAGLTLAMALLPEEFPVVLTVFLALGAWRISKRGVLTRRMPAIEMLGAATVLCCDKTGTLTENRMAVAKLWCGGRWHTASHEDECDAALLATGALACETDAFDPMERAILGASAALGAGAGADLRLEKRYPLSGGFLAVCHAWRTPDGRGVLALKGAPESVLEATDAPAGAKDALLAFAAEAGHDGLRVLAVARTAWDDPWPERLDGIAFRFLGLIALADPLRPNVPQAVALARRAGVRVVMITGDHPQTALAIAREAGLQAHTAITGAELAAMDDAALAAAVKIADVFARVRPEQKLRLVQAYRAGGEVVAMTGDGVNDAPALKAAHIGVAMGRRGTDVAREAASLVLLEDDFTSLVATVRLGRRIYDNIRNAMRYLLAVHVPLAGMSFLPLAFGWPLFMFPVHVVFLEFVIDPACSIVFEAERADAHVMERPPRSPTQRLFTPRALAFGLIQGAALLAAVAAVYGMALASARLDGQSRALAFVTLVTGNLALILVNRSQHLPAWRTLAHPNRALWIIVGGTLAALAAVIVVPSLADVFRFATPVPVDVALAALAGIGSVLWWDALKPALARASGRR